MSPEELIFTCETLVKNNNICNSIVRCVRSIYTNFRTKNIKSFRFL